MTAEPTAEPTKMRPATTNGIGMRRRLATPVSDVVEKVQRAKAAKANESRV